MSGPDWRRVRDEYRVVPFNFNTGSLGSCPRRVSKAVQEASALIDLLPTRHYWQTLLLRVEGIRSNAARLLGCAPDEVALTRNTTEGLTIVARGLGLEPGDVVAITNHEHPGNEGIWRLLEKTRRIEVRVVPIPLLPNDPAEVASAVIAGLGPRTRVLSLPHMLCTTGLLLPIDLISKAARERGVFTLVDGAHPPGMISVDVTRLGCDAYASSAHKWLCAPRGTGLLYVRHEWIDRLEPLYAGDGDWAGETAARFEAFGTRNLPELIGLGAALEFYFELTPAAVEARVRQLSELLRARVAETAGLTLLTPSAAWASAALTAVATPVAPRALADALWERQRIVVKPVSDAALREANAVRLSTHVYNTEDEVEMLVTSLAELATEAGGARDGSSPTG